MQFCHSGLGPESLLILVVRGMLGGRSRGSAVAVAFDLFQDPFFFVTLQAGLVGVLPDKTGNELAFAGVVFPDARLVVGLFVIRRAPQQVDHVVGHAFFDIALLEHVLQALVDTHAFLYGKVFAFVFLATFATFNQDGGGITAGTCPEHQGAHAKHA